jgi:hypothetical protein
MSINALRDALSDGNSVPLDAFGTTFAVGGVIAQYLEESTLSGDDREPLDEFVAYVERRYNAMYRSEPGGDADTDTLNTLPLHKACVQKLDQSNPRVALLLAYCTALAGLTQSHPDLPDFADKMFFQSYVNIEAYAKLAE